MRAKRNVPHSGIFLVLTEISIIPKAKSLYISRAVSNFYETEIEIWTDFGPVGNTGKINLGRV
jgi:hypothetical protein